MPQPCVLRHPRTCMKVPKMEMVGIIPTILIILVIPVITGLRDCQKLVLTTF